MADQSPPLVAVLWHDAHSPVVTSVIDVESTTLGGAHGPVKMCTVGWMLKFNRAGVSVANECVDDGDYRGHTFILRSMVREIRILTKQPLGRRPVLFSRSKK